MDLYLIRKELDMYDNAIKNMITLRMALIPIVAKIKQENNLPLYQGKREDEIYYNIELFAEKYGVDRNLVQDIYKLIIENALKIEEEVVNNTSTSVLSNEISFEEIKNMKSNFEKLDNILSKDIPNIISQINTENELNNLNLTQKATIYYENKINNKGDDKNDL